MCFGAMGKHEEVIASCDEAIELQPDYLKAYSRRANSLRTLGGKVLPFFY